VARSHRITTKIMPQRCIPTKVPLEVLRAVIQDAGSDAIERLPPTMLRKCCYELGLDPPTKAQFFSCSTSVR
jgi:hypothetical protein